ncbi:MAG: AAA family ATPase [Thermoleophilaceae bacterium]
MNIAIGLLGRQPILLLDEPSSALDPRQRERVWDFVLSLAEGGTTVVYSTHDIAEAERHANRVMVLADGESIFTGAPHTLQDALVETDALDETGIHAGFVHGDRGAGRKRLGQRDFEQAFVAFLRSKGH